MDISLYYQEQGNKEPLILLHGNGEDGSYFKNQINYFSDKYRVIALDTRGHGKSPRGTKPFTIEQFSCDLYDFMTNLEIPIEIGYKIARQFASKSPNAKQNAEMLGLMVNEPNIGLDELLKITVPTLVICGNRDIIKESHTKMIAENIPNAKLSIIKGNHFIANKRYIAFNKEVEDFLHTIQ